MKTYVIRFIISISVVGAGCLFYFHDGRQQQFDDGAFAPPDDMATTMEMSTNLKGYKRVDDGFMPTTAKQGTFNVIREKASEIIDDVVLPPDDTTTTTTTTLREDYNTTAVFFENEMKDESISVTTRCSQDGGVTHSTTTTEVPAMGVVEACKTNGGHFYFSAVSESGGCEWNGGCEYEFDGVCMKKVNVGNHERVTIILEPCV